MIRTSHALRRYCSLVLAVGYACLSLIVPFHTHVHTLTNSPIGSAHAFRVSNASSSGRAHLNGKSAARTTVHCAACEWEAVVTSQAASRFVVEPIQTYAVSYAGLIARSALALPCTTSSRGPPAIS